MEFWIIINNGDFTKLKVVFAVDMAQWYGSYEILAKDANSNFRVINSDKLIEIGYNGLTQAEKDNVNSRANNGFGTDLLTWVENNKVDSSTVELHQAI